MEWAGWLAFGFLSLCGGAVALLQAATRQRERKQVHEIQQEDFRDKELSQVRQEDRERLAILEREMKALQSEVNTLRVELMETRTAKALVEKDLALAQLELRQVIQEKATVSARNIELEAGRAKLTERIHALEAQAGIRSSDE